jgi:hypothetical protein
MFTQFGAKLAAVRSVAAGVFHARPAMLAAISLGILALGGCLPTRGPLAGADPADPSVKVAGVRYRSTVAPYSSLRPVAPSPWKALNDNAAPAPKSGR